MEEGLLIFFFFFIIIYYFILFFKVKAKPSESLTLRLPMSLSTWELASKLKTKGYRPTHSRICMVPFSIGHFLSLSLCQIMNQHCVWFGTREKEKGKKISEKRGKRRDFPRLVERNLCKGNEKFIFLLIDHFLFYQVGRKSQREKFKDETHCHQALVGYFFRFSLSKPNN